MNLCPLLIHFTGFSPYFDMIMDANICLNLPISAYVSVSECVCVVEDIE